MRIMERKMDKIEKRKKLDELILVNGYFSRMCSLEFLIMRLHDT